MTRFIFLLCLPVTVWGQSISAPPSSSWLSNINGSLTVGSSVTASAFFGDGSHLTNISSGSIASGSFVLRGGDQMTGPLQLNGSTLTVGGASFSVGGSSFSVTYGSATLAYQFIPGSISMSGPTGNFASGSSVTASAFFGDGSHLTGTLPPADIPNTITSSFTITGSGGLLVTGNSFTVGTSTFAIVGGSVGINNTNPLYTSDITGNQRVTGQSIVGGSMTLTGAMGVTGVTSLYNNTTVIGSMTVTNSESFTGTLTNSGVILSTGSTNGIQIHGQGNGSLDLNRTNGSGAIKWQDGAGNTTMQMVRNATGSNNMRLYTGGVTGQQFVMAQTFNGTPGWSYDFDSARVGMGIAQGNAPAAQLEVISSTGANQPVVQISSVNSTGMVFINGNGQVNLGAQANVNNKSQLFSFNNSTTSLSVSGWAPANGASANSGSIRLGAQVGSISGFISYDASAPSLDIGNNRNNATAPVRFLFLGDSGTLTEAARINSTSMGILTGTPCSTCTFQVAGSGVFMGNLLQRTALSCATGVQTDSTGLFSACVASDQKLKTSIYNLQYDDKVIDSLRPVSYRWKKSAKRDDDLHSGFIANDVKKILPTAAIPAGENLLGLDSNALIAELVLEVQQLRKRVKALEKR